MVTTRPVSPSTVNQLTSRLPATANSLPLLGEQLHVLIGMGRCNGSSPGLYHEQWFIGKNPRKSWVNPMVKHHGYPWVMIFKMLQVGLQKNWVNSMVLACVILVARKCVSRIQEQCRVDRAMAGTANPSRHLMGKPKMPQQCRVPTPSWEDRFKIN